MAAASRLAVRGPRKKSPVKKTSDSARGMRLLVVTTMVGAIGALPSTLAVDVRAQSPAVRSVRAAKGLMVSPVYEGWYEVDGTRYALFGYYNRNLEEIVDVPVGPHNHVAPGPPDQGQPTRFFPGMSYGVFAVAVPKDQPKAEVTWTLTAHGQTLSIPVSLDPLYLISPQRETGSGYPGNTPPVLKFDPVGPSAQGPRGIVAIRTATVSRPLLLDVWVTDDGLPPSRPGARAPVALTSLHLGFWEPEARRAFRPHAVRIGDGGHRPPGSGAVARRRDGTRNRRVLVQRQMRAGPLVVRTIEVHQSLQARFVEYDHVIETFASSGTHGGRLSLNVHGALGPHGML